MKKTFSLFKLITIGLAFAAVDLQAVDLRANDQVPPVPPGNSLPPPVAPSSNSTPSPTTSGLATAGKRNLAGDAGNQRLE